MLKHLTERLYYLNRIWRAMGYSIFC